MLATQTDNHPAPAQAPAPAPAGAVPAEVPQYDVALSAFHVAFAGELEELMGSLSLPMSGQVLDVPCGDGFYTLGLARQLFPFGQVVAADACDGYLKRAHELHRQYDEGGIVRHQKADVYAMPFDDGRFDAIWCAQSLISLENIPAALAEMARVTRPGGTLYVLENDGYHHVLMNWPVDLELAIQRAHSEACKEEYGESQRVAPSRDLPGLLARAGWSMSGKRSVVADRHAPFDAATRQFLRAHLQELRAFIKDHLTDAERQSFDRWCDPGHPQSFFRSADAHFSCLNTLFTAERDR